jgi:GDP-D-mannose dehydratase
MPPKKLTKKEKELALEQERLEREEYEKSVDERVKEIMELPPDEQRTTIREFVIQAFNVCGLTGLWDNASGKLENEKYYVLINNNPILVVQINPAFYRPAEVDLLLGDSTLAQKELGWRRRTTFEQLVEKMVQHDLA